MRSQFRTFRWNAARQRLAKTAIFALTLCLTGCSGGPFQILHPSSSTAISQRDLLFIALGLMLLVVLPVWAMAIWFPWRYRARKKQINHEPRRRNSPKAEAVIWLVPAVIVVTIGTLVWIYSHRLDPYRPVAGPGTPIHIEAVSLDWKWVFLYPQSGIATVNELVLPVNRPVEMTITSDTVMNALFIPGLAGQIFAMAGMQTKLNFLPAQTGDFTGRNMQYSGGAFPDQHFQVHIESAADYAAFLKRLSKSGNSLSLAAYQALQSDKSTSPVREYARFDSGLFKKIIDKYCASNCTAEASPQERQ